MRFKKGSKVEVLKRKEVPSGCWWCAEIVCGNGHNYSVRYDQAVGTMDPPIVERVSRKAIRPCPPPVVKENWVHGDIVEVYENNSWSIAEISKVMGSDYISVRLLGSSHEFRIKKSHLRVRQFWKDNQWVVIEKEIRTYDQSVNSQSRNYLNSNCQVPLPDVKMKAHAGDDQLIIEKGNDFLEPFQVSSTSLKRGLQFCSSHFEMQSEARQKLRAIEKEGRHRRLGLLHQPPLMEKVDAVASPQKMLGENYMHASFNLKTNGSSEIILERGKSNADIGRFSRRSLEPDVESTTCSVASCSSTTRDPYKLDYLSVGDNSEDTDYHSDDATSSSEWEYGRKFLFHSNEDIAKEIHKLELRAYRLTMEALYASGPISWEQEAMMTNLRLTLHITNDEHMLELRHLVSAEGNLPIN